MSRSARWKLAGLWCEIFGLLRTNEKLMDFDQIVNAIDNSNQEASSGQMATILSTMQQLSDSYGADPSTVQSVLSIVGNYVRRFTAEALHKWFEEAQPL